MSSTTYRYGPLAAASDGTNHLILAQSTSGGGRRLVARLMRPDGTAARPLVTVNNREGAAATSLAFNGTDFVAVFSAGEDVYGQLIDRNGNPLDAFDGGDFVVSNAVAPQDVPDIAHVGGAFTAVFRDQRWPQRTLYTQRFDGTGRTFSTTASQNELLYAGVGSVSQARIASAGSTALVIWTLGGVLYGQALEP
jgi:hypothetical protein